MNQVSVTINGKQYEHEVEPRLLLVHYIRDKARLTGTHVGCDTGNCGACTILYNGQLVKSCLMLAVQADHAQLTTIEGLGAIDRPGALASLGAMDHLAENGLHPIQDAFIEKFGFQCGYCTPGMILNAYALLGSNPDPSEDEIVEALEGNLCMCTGYLQIIEAIKHAARQMKGTRT